MNASPSARAFLRFNVSLPSGATVTGARLNMYSTSTSPSAGYQAYAVSNTTWGETSITSGNAPAFGAKLGGSATWTAPSWQSITLPASYIHAGLNSIGATTTSTYTKLFNSRETTSKPQLLVDYTVPGTSTGTGPLAPSTGALFGAFHQDPPGGGWT
jgi:hypothetical protein